MRGQRGYLRDMVRYRIVWGCLCGLVVVLGIVAALLVLPAAALVPLFMVPGLLGLMLALLVRADTGRFVGRVRRALAVAAVAGAACVGGAGLLAVLGPSALLIGVIAAAGSPPVVRRFTSKGDKGEKHDELRELSTLMLCRQWQSSYEELRAEPAVSRRLEIVRERERCLDELERRDPAGLQAWLASSASAASDPARFLTEPPQAEHGA